MDLPGLAILVALLLGAALEGIVGAMVSVPTAVLVAVLVDEYLVSKRRRDRIEVLSTPGSPRVYFPDLHSGAYRGFHYAAVGEEADQDGGQRLSGGLAGGFGRRANRRVVSGKAYRRG